jgi:FAD/FMN-containing dehydrogenase
MGGLRCAKGDLMTAQTIDALRARVTGPAIALWDQGYDGARKVNDFMIDRHLAAIAQCRSADDVVAVLRPAAQAGAELAGRGGEHSVPGYGTGDGVLVAD